MLLFGVRQLDIWFLECLSFGLKIKMIEVTSNIEGKFASGLLEYIGHNFILIKSNVIIGEIMVVICLDNYLVLYLIDLHVSAQLLLPQPATFPKTH